MELTQKQMETLEAILAAGGLICIDAEDKGVSPSAVVGLVRAGFAEYEAKLNPVMRGLKAGTQKFDWRVGWIPSRSSVAIFATAKGCKALYRARMG